jgi:hypothetical protein
MPPDDGRMTETCCGNNIGRGEEELLRWRTHNCFVKPLMLRILGISPARSIGVFNCSLVCLWGNVRLSPLGKSATNGLPVQAPARQIVLEQSVGWEMAGETEVRGENQPHHESLLTWPETWHRTLTAWATQTSIGYVNPTSADMKWLEAEWSFAECNTRGELSWAPLSTSTFVLNHNQRGEYMIPLGNFHPAVPEFARCVRDSNACNEAQVGFVIPWTYEL